MASRRFARTQVENIADAADRSRARFERVVREGDAVARELGLIDCARDVR
jgi:hypothetical protein